MNIKTADRLLTLRKEHGFSQEELAEKLGISRQAISKWERAEASPDTDNLIELAKLYGISLDDLLQFSEKANAESETDTAEQTSTEEEQKETDNDTPNSDTVHFGSNGIHVETKDGSKVHVGFDGIYVKENNKDEININAKKGDKIHVGQDGIYFADKNGEKIKIDDHERHYSHRRDRMKDTPWRFFPYPIVATIIFFLWGFLLNGWSVSWLIFLTIPLYYTLIEAVYKKNPMIFAYPVLCVLLFLAIGLCIGYWHIIWIIFLTIPLYYSIASIFNRKN